MKKFTLTLVIMMAMILLLPLHTIAAEEYDEDPTPYDTEEWYRGDTGELIDDIDAFILENVASNVNGGQINPINPTDLEETNESKDLSITLPMYNTTYTSSKTKTYKTISSGDTTFSTSILTGFKSGDSLVVCKKTTAMATFDF